MAEMQKEKTVQDHSVWQQRMFPSEDFGKDRQASRQMNLMLRKGGEDEGIMKP